MQEVYDELLDRKADLIAVSPNIGKWAQKTVDDLDLRYHVVSDHKLDVIKQYKLDYEVDEETKEMLRDFLETELDTFNGEGGWQLPVPATYILDNERTIQWAYANEDYKERPSGKRIVAAIDELRAE